jgi:hypothetical protein
VSTDELAICGRFWTYRNSMTLSRRTMSKSG